MGELVRRQRRDDAVQPWRRCALPALLIVGALACHVFAQAAGAVQPPGAIRPAGATRPPSPDDETPGRVRLAPELPVPPLPDGVEGIPNAVIPGHSEQEPSLPYAERVVFDESLATNQADSHGHSVEHIPHVLEWPIRPLSDLFETLTHADHDMTPTELSGVPWGLRPIPDRPQLLLEQGERFLSPGFLSQGIELPGGAVWRPAVWVFGQHRTHFAYQDLTGRQPIAEWAQRLDLFAQLNLSGTERVLVGLRPVDQETRGMREFNSYDVRSGDWMDGWNSDVQTLFFEGDFGELFPGLDPFDTRWLDVGFSVGRQPLIAQQGLLINEDVLDLVSVTRNTVSGHGLLNSRLTGVFAWNRVNRNDSVTVNRPDPDARLLALMTESDFQRTTVNADVVFVDSAERTGSLLAYGVSAIQRIGGATNTYNTSFHVLGSFPTDGSTRSAGRGDLLFSQISWTPHGSRDIVYVNAFWAIDRFTSPARGPLQGGPLGQTGLLFAAAGLGRYDTALSNQAADAAGGSLGYQMFFDEARQQVVVELAGRSATDGSDGSGLAAGLRYQRAFRQHFVLIVDGLLAKQEGRSLSEGVRVELLTKF